MPPCRALLLVLAAALALAAPAAAAGWEPGDAADGRWQGVQRAGLALPPPVAGSLDAARGRAGWQREWQLIEGRLLSLGTLPADLAARTHAAFRRAVTAGGAPIRFAPDAKRDGRGAALGIPLAVQSGHARSPVAGWTGLHVWAEGAGYAVGRRSAGYGIECGASLSLDEAVDLTAGYRLAGYALGATLEAELDDVEDRIGTPFVGLDFRF